MNTIDTSRRRLRAKWLNAGEEAPRALSTTEGLNLLSDVPFSLSHFPVTGALFYRETTRNLHTNQHCYTHAPFTKPGHFYHLLRDIHFDYSINGESLWAPSFGVVISSTLGY